MRVLSYDKPGYAEWRKSAHRVAAPDAAVQKAVADILAQVRTGGDEAVKKLTAQFDKTVIRSLVLSGKPAAPSKPVAAALKEARDNIAAFAKARLPKAWSMRNSHGARVGEAYRPFQRVGVYVPGGTAPLVSTALMTVTIAKVAGCKEVVAVTPPPVNPVLHWALQLAGADEIYQIGGAQAIGALAFGTESVRPVEKIVGPGNAFVTEAKRQVVGFVSIDQLPGPSEILVLADASANPAWIAADLLAQGEHGKGSQAVLVTPSAPLIQAVLAELEKQRTTLSRTEMIDKTLESGCVLVRVKNMAEAVAIANDYAAEHLSLQVKDARKWVPKLTTSGAIFVGGISPVVAGDFVAGPSHTLPTGGAARSFSGLTTADFFRRTSVVEYTPAALKKALPAITRFSEVEKLDAHGRSAQIRFSQS